MKQGWRWRFKESGQGWGGKFRVGWWLETSTKMKSLMEMFEDALQTPLYFNNTNTGNGDRSRSGLSGGSVTVKEDLGS